MGVFSESEQAALRADFPYLATSQGAPPVYLDWAATAQRPLQVLDAERDFLLHHYAAVHRGASMATGEATSAFEGARQTVAEFVGATAASGYELVWAQGATDALNLLATGIGEANAAPELRVEGSEVYSLGPGDEVLVTEDAHHANLIPWQRLAARTGASLRYVPVGELGTWSAADVARAASARTRVFAFTLVSNVTGAVAPVREALAALEAAGSRAITVLDGCQAVPHMPVDVAALGVDFLVFSGHKMLGPNGIGALVGRSELLAALPPARTGGSAITRVSMERAEFLPAPHRFEPGTQAVSQAVGLAAAARYLQGVGMQRVAQHGAELTARLVAGVQGIAGVRLLGPADMAGAAAPDFAAAAAGGSRVALVAVAVDGVHAHDVGQFLDSRGITVRVGHHCAQPLHRALGITASTRASVHLTSTADEVDAFLDALSGVRSYFA